MQLWFLLFDNIDQFKIKIIAFELIKKDPKLLLPDNKIVRENLMAHYSENLKYAKTA